ncbi:MAG: hypothetical protein HRU38_08790 [Saccharospirillaceae bacterium]|nr:hypothetical protein [Saccharospirillaceae bacterium]
MMIAEKLVWFIIPLCMVIMLNVVLHKSNWFKAKPIYIVLIIFAVLGVLLAPTALCVDVCSKLLVTSLMATVINLILMILVVMSCYLKYQINNRSKK